MPTDPNCVFCKIAAGDIPAKVVHRDEHLTAFQDLDPKAPTHILLVPNDHLHGISAAGEAHAELLGRLLLAANRLAQSEGIAAGGYRIVINSGPDAGQSVFHLHLHLLGGRKMAWPPG